MPISILLASIWMIRWMDGACTTVVARQRVDVRVPGTCNWCLVGLTAADGEAGPKGNSATQHLDGVTGCYRGMPKLLGTKHVSQMVMATLMIPY